MTSTLVQTQSITSQSRGLIFNSTMLTELGLGFVCSAIANQESLSILEVEMRKLEGVVKEISDEMDYLKRREERMRDTNGEPRSRVALML